MGSVQRQFPLPGGIFRVDEQHQELDKLLGRLLETLAVDPGGALPEFRFAQLAEQTLMHFKAEEDWLRSLGYPDLFFHRMDHQKILECFRLNLVRWHSPDPPPLPDLVAEFAEVTRRHLNTADQAFVLWLEKRQQEPVDG